MASQRNAVMLLLRATQASPGASEKGGQIVRTCGQFLKVSALQGDIRELQKVWLARILKETGSKATHP